MFRGPLGGAMAPDCEILGYTVAAFTGISGGSSKKAAVQITKYLARETTVYFIAFKNNDSFPNKILICNLDIF